MKKTNSRNLSCVLGIAGLSLACLMAFGRCSPIAPSADKNDLLHTGSAHQLPGISPARPEQFNGQYSTQVLAGTDYSANREAESADEKVIALSDADVDAFRNHGKVMLALDEDLPPEGSVRLELTDSSEDIQDLGLSDFKTKLTRLGGGKWELSVDPAIASSVYDTVLKDVVSIELVFKLRPNPAR